MKTFKAITQNHLEVREMIRKKIESSQNIELGKIKRSGRVQKDFIKVKNSKFFSVSVATLNNWRRGISIGENSIEARQKLYILIMSCDDEILEKINEVYNEKKEIKC